MEIFDFQLDFFRSLTVVVIDQLLIFYVFFHYIRYNWLKNYYTDNNLILSSSNIYYMSDVLDRFNLFFTRLIFLTYHVFLLIYPYLFESGITTIQIPLLTIYIQLFYITIKLFYYYYIIFLECSEKIDSMSWYYFFWLLIIYYTVFFFIRGSSLEIVLYLLLVILLFIFFSSLNLKKTNNFNRSVNEHIIKNSRKKKDK